MRCARAVAVGASVFVLHAGAVAGTVVERVVAVVNDEAIWYSDYQRDIARHEAMAGSRIEKDKLVDLMIDDRLVKQEAALKDVEVSQGEVETRVKRIRDQFPSDEAYQESLKLQEGLTADKHREQIKRDLMAQRIVEMEVTQKVSVGDRDIEEFFQQHKQEFEDPETVRLRVFQTKNEKTLALALKELGKGTAFVEVVKKYGDQAIQATGGDIGQFQMTELNETITKAVKSLRVGEFSRPVKEGDLFMVFRIEDRIPGRQLALSDTVQVGQGTVSIKDRVRRVLYEKQFQERFEAWVKSLRAKAVIEKKPLS